MEVGQSSGSISPDQVWAKFVPSKPSYESIDISSSDMMVSSQVTSTLQKLEWCQILRNSDRCSATIINKSSNAILVDGAVLQSEEAVGIKCGTEIVPAAVKEGNLSYKFEVMPMQEECPGKNLKLFIDADHAKCSICLNIWHDVVTVAPCLHNFCNGCFSEWLRRCQEKHSNVLCPQCRAVVQFVGRNHFLRNIEEDILLADVSLQRSKEELAALDSYSSIKSNLVIGNGKKSNRKRARSPIPIYEESEDDELPCRQCGTSFGGFRCSENTIHLQCQACGGMMPSRPDFSIPQHCLGCNRAFCGAYWHAQGVSPTDHYPMCSPETFKPISDRTVSAIPPVAHGRNRFEQDITDRCIRKIGKTLQQVVSEWVAKLHNREIDRSTMPLSHADMITAATQ